MEEKSVPIWIAIMAQINVTVQGSNHPGKSWIFSGLSRTWKVLEIKA